MARQVTLLSFDGEFDRPAALKALGQNLVAEFELERIPVEAHPRPGEEGSLMADLKNIALTPRSCRGRVERAGMDRHS